MADIPEAILDCLEEMRNDGEFNMIERNSVIKEMLERADAWEEPEWREAGAWLMDNQARYMEALKAMGARRSASG